MNIHSIKVRIVALSALCVTLATGAVLGYSIYSSGKTSAYVSENVDSLLDRLSKDSLSRLASTQAGVIRAETDSAFDAARATARALESIARGVEVGGSPIEARRSQLNDILLRNLKDNERFNGTYSAWLPNALDGRDQAYVNRKDAGSDDTGRALPYWTRDAQGKIALQPLVEYNSRELHPNGVMKGGWFLGPQSNGKESILAPCPISCRARRSISPPCRSRSWWTASSRASPARISTSPSSRRWRKRSTPRFTTAREPSPSSPTTVSWSPPAARRPPSAGASTPWTISRNRMRIFCAKAAARSAWTPRTIF